MCVNKQTSLTKLLGGISDAQPPVPTNSSGCKYVVAMAQAQWMIECVRKQECAEQVEASSACSCQSLCCLLMYLQRHYGLFVTEQYILRRQPVEGTWGRAIAVERACASGSAPAWALVRFCVRTRHILLQIQSKHEISHESCLYIPPYLLQSPHDPCSMMCLADAGFDTAGAPESLTSPKKLFLLVQAEYPTP